LGISFLDLLKSQSEIAILDIWLSNNSGVGCNQSSQLMSLATFSLFSLFLAARNLAQVFSSVSKKEISLFNPALIVLAFC
jgi:hypothetical protein